MADRYGCSLGWYVGWIQLVRFRIAPWEGVILGANVGHPIVTNGEFAKVCEPLVWQFGVVCGRGGDVVSSKITLGNIVITYY